MSDYNDWANTVIERARKKRAEAKREKIVISGEPLFGKREPDPVGPALRVKLIGCVSSHGAYVVYDAETDKMLGYTDRADRLDYDVNSRPFPTPKTKLDAVSIDESPWD